MRSCQDTGVSSGARILAAAVACTLVSACGSSGAPAVSVSPAPTAPSTSIPPPAHSAAAALLDWPEFGLDPGRSDASLDSTGITTANLAHLRRKQVALPGTVDSSPVYLHGVTVAGASANVAVLTTTYGRTLALDANSGRILWVFTPPGYSRWAGTAQITTASPLADPNRRFVYAASPNGLIHKLSLADGREDSAGGWPVSITRDPTHEKLAAALNIEGPYVIAATGGYLGDAPPYQGHVVLIERSSGHIHAVFNTLCAQRRALLVPSACASTDSAILSRAGPVVEPGGRILISTGNGPWNGSSDFGDSVIELDYPALTPRQAYTPTDQAQLNETDTDLGSSGPVLLGHDRAVVAGKDGIVRVLSLSRLDGRAPRGVGLGVAGSRERLGGELQTLPLPGGGQLFTAPAVWRLGTHTTMFVAGEHGTGAYTLRGGRLRVVWQNATPGTSPVLAGGLLYVYDPDAGGIDVYLPRSPRPIAHLAGEPGHWNSPIVVDGHVLEPEGNANDHRQTGTLDLFSVG
jgi:DNA-binding beta-propeller fold protein YncE